MFKPIIADILLENFKSPVSSLFRSENKRWHAKLAITAGDPSTKLHRQTFYFFMCSKEAVDKPLRGVSHMDPRYIWIIDDTFEMKKAKNEIIARISKIKAKDWDDFCSQMACYFMANEE